MKRCLACGAFFDLEDCPNDHSFVEPYMPPPRILGSRTGHWTTHTIDGVECPALFVTEDRVCVFGPGSHVHVTDHEEGA